jgi:hypothetical protein
MTVRRIKAILRKEFCQPHGHPAQIDARIHGKDISGFHIYLCHNDKSFDGCCISDSKSGMILS